MYAFTANQLKSILKVLEALGDREGYMEGDIYINVELLSAGSAPPDRLGYLGYDFSGTFGFIPTVEKEEKSDGGSV